MNLNNGEGLHWSFDYNYGAQNPDFAQQLLETFLRFYAGPKTDRIGAESVEHIYEIYPNYWRGYAIGEHLQDNLSLGEAIIKRQQAGDGRWNYTIQYINGTSCEDLQLRFRTANDLYRSLRVSGTSRHRTTVRTAILHLQQGLIAEDELPPLPENFHYDESETVLQQVCRRTDDALIHSAILNGIRDWDELHWRYLIWNYYRFIEKVDAEIGIVLNALQGTPFYDDTVIVFSADHGEACGSHQMFQKFTLYEESIRVPFIVACLGEGVPVQKHHFDREHFISGVDLVPTVYDYAGIDAAETVQPERNDVPRLSGMSVRPLAEGDEIPWREYAYVESNHWGRAVVTDRYKYVTEYKPAAPEDFRPPGPDASRLGRAQLFDLQADPWETQNLVSESGYEDVINACRANLLAHEATLNRWQIEHPNPRSVISNWGERLRAHWTDISAS